MASYGALEFEAGTSASPSALPRIYEAAWMHYKNFKTRAACHAEERAFTAGYGDRHRFPNRGPIGHISWERGGVLMSE